MATTGTLFVACILLCFASQSIDAADFVFDLRSCDSLLPQPDAVTPGRPNQEPPADDVFPKSDRKSPQNTLVPSTEYPPYTIVMQRTGQDGQDKLYTVKIGGELNGFILQARRLGTSNPQSKVSGTFIDPPPGVKYLDCGTGSSADTAVSTDTSLKKSVELVWKSPSDNLKDIQFAATFVKNNYYWPNFKSNPLLFVENPPNFKNCGKDTNCYRYSGTSGECTDLECNFVFVSEVYADQVAFTVGGKIAEPTGYVGVAFTNDKFGKLELFGCVKESKDAVEVKQYVTQGIESQPEEHFTPLLSSSSSLDHGLNYVLCRVQRLLQINGSQVSDFTQPQAMMFLRGPVTKNSGGLMVPQLGKSSVFAENPWNSAALMDKLVTVNGVSRGEPGMCLILVSLLVTFILAAANEKYDLGSSNPIGVSRLFTCIHVTNRSVS